MLKAFRDANAGAYVAPAPTPPQPNEDAMKLVRASALQLAANTHCGQAPELIVRAAEMYVEFILGTARAE